MQPAGAQCSCRIKMSLVPSLLADFQTRFGRPPETVARAPGRVNLIGEHTDYNDGFVLPIAVQMRTIVLGASRPGGAVRVFSRATSAEAAWMLDVFDPNTQPGWARYVAGVLALLKRRGARITGCDLLIDSDVPMGGGLASSAALEVAVALTAADLAGEPIESRELIDLCRQAEHEFAGVPCGLMDQSVCLLAKVGHALLLDCRSRDTLQVPCPTRGHVFVVIDSGQRHELADGEYAARRAQCAEAVAYFSKITPSVRSLRDVSYATVRAHAAQMEPLAAVRALHVTGEIERTRAGADALRMGDLASFGRLMAESHRSLRDHYQVSTRAIEKIVEVVSAAPGVLGVRLTGAGFGGCVVALVAEQSVSRLRTALEQGGQPGPAQQMHVCQPSAGASLLRHETWSAIEI